MIKYCSCTNYLGNSNSAIFQDRRYGHGNRVHNKGQNGKYNCTICGKQHVGNLTKKGKT